MGPQYRVIPRLFRTFRPELFANLARYLAIWRLIQRRSPQVAAA
jgi:hypothetical protein